MLRYVLCVFLGAFTQLRNHKIKVAVNSHVPLLLFERTPWGGAR